MNRVVSKGRHCNGTWHLEYRATPGIQSTGLNVCFFFSKFHLISRVIEFVLRRKKNRILFVWNFQRKKEIKMSYSSDDRESSVCLWCWESLYFAGVDFLLNNVVQWWRRRRHHRHICAYIFKLNFFFFFLLKFPVFFS